MSAVHLRDLGIPRNQPEEREGPFTSRRSGFLQHGKGHKTKGDNAHTPITLQIKQRPQTRGLKRYRSSTSAPPTPQRSVPMEHGKQEVQTGLTLVRTWGKLAEYMSPGVIFKKPYENNQRLESQKEIQTVRRGVFQNKGE
ncbi:hypothetical protein O181_007767 [Austropuccinia psidii MF-1]|uniref:Uncharacterized protein n=1 Tax=Austropuccinia psidii MF-1 TaxID=1389203 RepID=A0A9Q3BMK7_9BASI|nr:hypothetical protein [Austropuccinia psidii MF-1]